MKPDRTLRAAFDTPKLSSSMNLKKQLNFYLDANGMTASQLAKRASVPKQSLSGWLAGSNPRDVRQIKRVADVLGTTVDNLMFQSGAVSSKVLADSFDTLIGDDWMSGLFEIKIRKIKR